MPQEVRLWKIEDGGRLQECARTSLDLESRLEEWLAQDISMLSDDLLVIGRQVETDFGGLIDLLCIDQAGDLVIVELKRDKTPREVTAQALDYASWVNDLSSEKIMSIAARYLGRYGLEDSFTRRFATEFPDTLNEHHRILIVGSEIDAASERIITYLSETYGVDVNAATFQYFQSADGGEFLARVFLIEPGHVEYQTRTRGGSKRRPNLTYEELAEVAQRNGVGDCYQRLVTGLERRLQTGTTRSSIQFLGNFDGSRRVVLSLIPQDSNRNDGLRFQIYIERFKRLLHLGQDEAAGLLPERREPWVYASQPGPDWSGYAGYFASEEEVERFLAGLTDREPVAL